MEHLQTSMSAIARLVRLLHSFILYEDLVRVAVQGFEPAQQSYLTMLACFFAVFRCLEFCHYHFDAETPTENDVDHPTSHLGEMAAFLDRGDATLRLFLHLGKKVHALELQDLLVYHSSGQF
jgi:hypothetical protein